MKDFPKNSETKIVIISILLIFCFILLYYFTFIINSSIIFSHFFYFPIILACLWFKKKGLIIPLLLSTLLLVFPLFRGLNIFDLNNLDNILRALSLSIIGLVVSFLSEQRSKTELELTEVLTDLKRSNADLQQFAYVASHDIKEPLRAIISFSELLEEE